MESLENGSSKVPIALDSLIVSSPVTVQGGRTDIYGQIAPVFSEYIAPQPAACYATTVPTAFAAPAPVVERISPDFARYAVPVPVVESSPAAPAPVVGSVSPDPAECVAPACKVKIHRCRDSGKPCCTSAHSACRVGSCRGTHFSSSGSVCRTCCGGGAHHSSRQWQAMACQCLFLQLLQCMPYLFLWWKTFLQILRCMPHQSSCRGVHRSSSCRGKHFCRSYGVCRTRP